MPKQMTKVEFDKRVAATGRSGLSVEAAKLVLVDGKGVREAARTMKIDATVTSRMVAQLRDLKLCGTCGQAIKEG